MAFKRHHTLPSDRPGVSRPGPFFRLPLHSPGVLQIELGVCSPGAAPQGVAAEPCWRGWGAWAPPTRVIWAPP